ncbi:MAG: YqcI/YcgG family protein [Verrucomicrobiaceae bacterium]|nr:YqcI/YcgG family protein [Verrucomicrobiaceae bacterium]
MKGNQFARGNAKSSEAAPDSFAAEAGEAFRQLVFQPAFPCLGAKAAFNSGSNIVRRYGELASCDSTRELSADLRDFTQSELRRTSEYATFVAIFERPQNLNEVQFEELLWRQLRALHREDAARFDWDPSVRSDPADPYFSFSFAGQALYVIGMHANSSREARRFHWPALVFNPHEQFERLREDGNWKRMQETIRTRDRELQGTINPMLSDFGEKSEARQYSGRAVGEDWRAPFEVVERKCPFAH